MKTNVVYIHVVPKPVVVKEVKLKADKTEVTVGEDVSFFVEVVCEAVPREVESECYVYVNDKHVKTVKFRIPKGWAGTYFKFTLTFKEAGVYEVYVEVPKVIG